MKQIKIDGGRIKSRPFWRGRTAALTSTHEHTAGGWYVSDIRRVQIYPNAGGSFYLALTSAQDMAAIAALRRGYGVKGEAV